VLYFVSFTSASSSRQSFLPPFVIHSAMGDELEDLFGEDGEEDVDDEDDDEEDHKIPLPFARVR
jgi:hypothetical protein